MIIKTMDENKLNHHMVRILFFMKDQKESWLTSTDISSHINMSYHCFKLSIDKLVYSRLINFKLGIKYHTTAKLYQLNIKKR